MGKIRVKAFDESQEDKDKKLEAKREAKKLAKKAEKSSEEVTEEVPEVEAEGEPKKKSKKAKFAKQRVHGKRYQANLSQVDKNQKYTLAQAIEKLKGFQKTKFDETVELHINVKEKGISGQVVLPHGTGKVRRIRVVDDATISEIEAGKIDFDVLVAHPSMMPKLAKVARVLGPRGLMPNPKNGTITPNTDEAVEKLKGGQVSYKTEPQFPIIHMSVGKASFENEKLSENIKMVLQSVKVTNIVSLTLKSSMSPSIKVSL